MYLNTYQSVLLVLPFFKGVLKNCEYQRLCFIIGPSPLTNMGLFAYYTCIYIYIYMLNISITILIYTYTYIYYIHYTHIPVCFPKWKYHFAIERPSCPQCTTPAYGAWWRWHTNYIYSVYCIYIVYNMYN